MPHFACQCCGNLSLAKRGPGSGERCPNCDWIDDLQQYQNPSDPNGPNPVSLFTAQNNYEKFGACTETAAPKVQPAASRTVNPIWPTLLVCVALGFVLVVVVVLTAGSGIYSCLFFIAGLLGLFVLLALWLNRPSRWGQCKQCGYDLSGLRMRRCPECGQAF